MISTRRKSCQHDLHFSRLLHAGAPEKKISTGIPHLHAIQALITGIDLFVRIADGFTRQRLRTCSRTSIAIIALGGLCTRLIRGGFLIKTRTARAIGRVVALLSIFTGIGEVAALI